MLHAVYQLLCDALGPTGVSLKNNSHILLLDLLTQLILAERLDLVLAGHLQRDNRGQALDLCLLLLYID